MIKLLLIEASPRGEYSISSSMARRFVQAWLAANNGGEVISRHLVHAKLKFVDAAWLQAYFTPPGAHTAEMVETLRLSNELVAELLDADHIVIATPVYNYNVPAVLKAWVDHIVRKGLTLSFDGRGLLVGKKATVLIASGGVYTEGSPIRERDIATQYLGLILGLLGIEDITFVAGGGAKAVDLGEETMDDFLSKLGEELVQAAAK